MWWFYKDIVKRHPTRMKLFVMKGEFFDFIKLIDSDVDNRKKDGFKSTYPSRVYISFCRLWVKIISFCITWQCTIV